MSCARPVPWEDLVAYWAGDLDAPAEASLEEHLMGCASCTAESARVAAITEALRTMLPPVVTRARVESLRAEGVRFREDAFRPGERREATFTAGLEVLVFRLGGLELARAARVSLTLRAREGEQAAEGPPILSLGDVPFERDTGEILVACQRHYEVFPPDVVAEVRVIDASGDERVTTYGIDHRFERRAP
jgi:anti-sigma factor RsiW